MDNNQVCHEHDKEQKQDKSKVSNTEPQRIDKSERAIVRNIPSPPPETGNSKEERDFDTALSSVPLLTANNDPSCSNSRSFVDEKLFEFPNLAPYLDKYVFLFCQLLRCLSLFL